jgi:hypothetical protein
MYYFSNYLLIVSNVFRLRNLKIPNFLNFFVSIAFNFNQEHFFKAILFSILLIIIS